MFAALVLLVIVLLLLYTYSLNRKGDQAPPGPFRIPLIGSAWAMGTNILRTHVTVTNLAKKWGPIYQIYFSQQPVVVITSPLIIQEAFNGVQSPVLLRFICSTIFQLARGESILYPKSRQMWALCRKMSSSLPKNMPGAPSIPQIVNKELEKLVVHMEKHKGTGVYLHPWLMFFTRNVFLETAIRKSWSFETEDAEEREFNESMQQLLDNVASVADLIPALDFITIKSRATTLHYGSKIKNYILKLIEERSGDCRTDETARDFLDTLLIEQKRNTQITNDMLAVNIRDILFAATLTTSDTLDWLVMYLCNHHDIQEKCYLEITNVLHGRMPTMEDKNEMPFLDNVLKEILRLRPPAPLSLPHFADQDCTIGGYHIKKGTIVLENLYGIGNWDKFFPNSAQFDPTRWERNPELSSQLLHFGYGPTMCLGMPVAKQELFLAAACLLQRFKFRFLLGTSIDFTGEFKTVFSAKPWQVVYHPR